MPNQGGVLFVVIPLGGDETPIDELRELAADVQNRLIWASHVLDDPTVVMTVTAQLHADGHKWPDCEACP